jgi:hypothetical protein
VVWDKQGLMAGGSQPGGTAYPDESHWRVPASLHIGSHTDLLQPRQATARPPASPAVSLDAIIVPTNRSARDLIWAARLATALQCRLIAIYTDECPTDIKAVLDGQQPDRLTTIGLPEDYRPGVLNFLTHRHPQGVSPAHLDISRKRNLGLLLAKLCAWHRVLFLDDDIYDIDPDLVIAAAASLGSHSVAGFKVTDYPDNSVVCHAYRLAGGAQDTFIGGSALIVDPSCEESFFPPIYNEDWLFLANHIQAGRAAEAGTVRQLGYKPFKNPGRAFSEEFGDVIAEGLYHLFHNDLIIDDANIAFWRCMLQQREQLLDEIANRLVSNGSGNDIEPALLALAAAAKRLRDLSAIDFVSFLRAWRIDLADWQDRASKLPVTGSISGAAEYLEIEKMIGMHDDTTE